MVTVEPINKGKEQKAFDKTLMKMEKKPAVMIKKYTVTFFYHL